jgi:hypothetical protein
MYMEISQEHVAHLDLHDACKNDEINVINTDPSIKFGRSHLMENIKLSRDRLEVKVGDVSIIVLTAKEPHKPWDAHLKDFVLGARQSYFNVWGKVPGAFLEDKYDESSYVDLAFISYPDPDHEGRPGEKKMVTEGLTNRLITIRDLVAKNERLPEDLSFFIDSDGASLFEVFSHELYDDNTQLTASKLAVASRLSPIRAFGRKHNLYTAEAFAAIQVKFGFRAMLDGIDYIVSTMRPETDQTIFALPNGVSFSHIRTDDALGLERGSIKLNRDDKYVRNRMLQHLGYFAEIPSFVALLGSLMQSDPPALDAETFTKYGIDPGKINELKATRLKYFIPMVAEEGNVSPFLTGENLRQRIIQEVADGPASYAMTYRQRIEAGMRVLKASQIMHSQPQS